MFEEKRSEVSPGAEGSVPKSLLEKIRSMCGDAGPSFNERSLEELARATGGAFHAERSVLGSSLLDTVVIPYGLSPITVRMGVMENSRVPLGETRLTSPVVVSPRSGFSVSPDGFLRKVGNSITGIQDLFAEDLPFDQAFSVSGEDGEIVREVFDSSAIQAALLRFPDLRLTLGGADSSPSGSIELQISVSRVIEDTSELVALVDLAKAMLDRIDFVHRPEAGVARAVIRLQREPGAALDSEAIERVLRDGIGWAVHKETQIIYETVMNGALHEAVAAIKARSRGPVEASWWMNSPEEIVECASSRIADHPALADAQLDRSRLAAMVSAATQEERLLCLNILASGSPDLALKKIYERTFPERVVRLAGEKPLERCLDSQRWGEWYPGLETTHMTIDEVLRSLPGVEAQAVPDIVRRLENPESPFALPGAVSLPRHDILHILLGRGLLDQDEAFVIGFTMGTMGKELRTQDEGMMELAFANLYPEPYRISGVKLEAFKLGVEAGREMGMKRLAEYPLEELNDRTVGEAQRLVGIDPERLREVYRRERELIPGTLESARLPL